MTDASTRTRLISTAARLFQLKGYNGVGLAEILAAADAPKGSLYHHFPQGKTDLARAAAEWSSEVMLAIIDAAFEGKSNWQGGVAHLMHKLAKLFDLTNLSNSCPIKAILFDGPGDQSFHDLYATIIRSWQDRLAQHGRRLGLSEDRARLEAETLLIAIEGGWMLARALRSSDVLRSIPERLFA